TKCDVFNSKQLGLLPCDLEAWLAHVQACKRSLGKFRSQSQNALAGPATSIKKGISRYFGIIYPCLREQHMNQNIEVHERLAFYTGVRIRVSFVHCVNAAGYCVHKPPLLAQDLDRNGAFRLVSQHRVRSSEFVRPQP